MSWLPFLCQQSLLKSRSLTATQKGVEKAASLRNRQIATTDTRDSRPVVHLLP